MRSAEPVHTSSRGLVRTGSTLACHSLDFLKITRSIMTTFIDQRFSTAC